MRPKASASIGRQHTCLWHVRCQHAARKPNIERMEPVWQLIWSYDPGAAATYKCNGCTKYYTEQASAGISRESYLTHTTTIGCGIKCVRGKNFGAASVLPVCCPLPLLLLPATSGVLVFARRTGGRSPCLDSQFARMHSRNTMYICAKANQLAILAMQVLRSVHAVAQGS
jgi:hypothetical protein